jgi:hypothetical protein
VTGVCVKDCNDPGLCIPVSDVLRDELEVKNGRRQISFERQVSDAKGNSPRKGSYKLRSGMTIHNPTSLLQRVVTFKPDGGKST